MLGTKDKSNMIIRINNTTQGNKSDGGVKTNEYLNVTETGLNNTDKIGYSKTKVNSTS